jgi:hypothetical protein
MEDTDLINSLDLGCGEKPRNPLECENAYGLDIRDLDIENVVCADVVLEPIPFSDNFLMSYQHMILSSIFRGSFMLPV